RPTAHQLHVAFDLIVEILKGSFDPDLPRGREGIQIKSASRTRFRAQGEGFQNVGATANSAVANHIYPVADSIDDLGELIEWAPRPVELTSAVIGHHDSGRTNVQSTLCVRNTHDAFEAELFAPFLSDALGIFPIQIACSGGRSTPMRKSGCGSTEYHQWLPP